MLVFYPSLARGGRAQLAQIFLQGKVRGAQNRSVMVYVRIRAPQQRSHGEKDG